MKLHDYINEIWDIANENDKDVGVAKDMFLANIRNSQEAPTVELYHGADQVDFASLYPHLEELEKSANDYNRVVLEHYNEIVSLRAEGKRNEVVLLIKQ